MKELKKITELKRDVDILNNILYSKEDQRSQANDRIKPITLRFFTDFREIPTIQIKSDNIYDTFKDVSHAKVMIGKISSFLTYRFIETEIKEHDLNNSIETFNKRLSMYLNACLSTTFRYGHSEIIIDTEDIKINFDNKEVVNGKVVDKVRNSPNINVNFFNEKEIFTYLNLCVTSVLFKLYNDGLMQYKEYIKKRS